MTAKVDFDIIIIGGSYSGLAAGMALGRALRSVLIIDSGNPCNRQTPHSHNFITQDGKTPGEISSIAKQQVQRYGTVSFFDGLATKAVKTNRGFEILTASDELFSTRKLVFATGITDIMSPINGFSDCWGISVIHCPYCHGYEFKNQSTGILGNGLYGFEFSVLISNWTKDLTLFTNGPCTLTGDQVTETKKHGIEIIETEIEALEHISGYLQKIILRDGTTRSANALYARPAFEQQCNIPQLLGCAYTEEGYLSVDALQKTNVPGIFACGDNATRIRTVANAVSMGTTTGMMLNREIAFEDF